MGSMNTKPRDEEVERGIGSLVWFVVSLLAIAFIVFVAISTAQAQMAAQAAGQLRELRANLEEEARASALQEGPADGVTCMLVRRHGQTTICITPDEWRRQHAEDRSALPARRVGMRL